MTAFPGGMATENIAGARRRSPWIYVIIGVAVLCLIGGGVAVALVLLKRTPTSALPRTTAELEASVKETESYLNAPGKKLAGGRTNGLPIYSVDGTLDTSGKTVKGTESVLFANGTGDQLTEVDLRVYPAGQELVAKGASFTVTNSTANGKSTGCALKGSILKVTLPQPLANGGKVLLSFSFTETVPSVDTSLASMMPGQGGGGYGIFGQDGNTFNLGYWIPQVASYRNGKWEDREIPSYGDPADFSCSEFNVAFIVPDNFIAAGTGRVLSEQRSGGKALYRFAAGPVRDFAIVASNQFKVSSKKVADTTVCSYYVSKDVKPGNKVLDCGCDAVKQYTAHIGPYPYTRLNLCESPLSGSAGGMEFSGEVMISKMFYGNLGLDIPGLNLGDEESGGQLGDLLQSLGGGLLGDTLEFITAHEVCHEWFALVVGSDSVQNPWQDESLTNYVSILYFKWVHGQEAADKQVEQQLVNTYSMAGIMGGGDGIVTGPIDSFKDEMSYAAVVYGKGALFYRELEKSMGEEAFDKSLQLYYSTYAFLEPAPADLLKCFEQNAPNAATVASLEQRWLNEKHGSEDIASGSASGGLVQQLLDQLKNSGTDLGSLEDMLKNFLNGSAPGLDDLQL